MVNGWTNNVHADNGTHFEFGTHWKYVKGTALNSVRVELVYNDHFQQRPPNDPF